MLPIMSALREDPNVALQLLVSGGHLVAGQGRTVDEVTRDGFGVDETVDMVLAGDSAAAVSKSFGLGVIGYADALERLRPDVVLVTGDRYEALALAIAVLPRPALLAHLGGGQLTFGSRDEQQRHALTKLADIHLVFSPDDRRRVLQMGEDPARVHVIDTGYLWSSSFSSPYELERRIGMPLRKPTFLVTYHPATSDPEGSRRGITSLLRALDRVPEASLVFTAPNVDPGGDEITALIREFVSARSSRAAFVPSLGHRHYVSVMRLCDAVVGNSSSGITEAPHLGIPTVNVGSRQAGRQRVRSVIDCDVDEDSISEGLRLALSAGGGQDSDRPNDTRQQQGIADIVAVLKETDPGEVTTKRFFEHVCRPTD
jgi:UDP-N-acetylglucosamine 2-epimerase (non-hydrolysing)/GDP/UDP-N,N'-diacetylbacillosamine 2-epimerase (hydrolysing)